MSSNVTRCGASGAVVVFYRPDRACVARANRLAESGLCVVVDNTEQVSDAGALGLDARIIYVSNGENLGVATAINQGIERLLQEGCDKALIFDQDSEPSARLLSELPRLLQRELDRGVRVALIGPAYEDVRLGGVAPFVRFGYWRLQRVIPLGEEPVNVDFLITSGSCVNLAVWQEVGPMDDRLFIDFVDLEWCIRARSKGYVILGAPTVRLKHELGGEPVNVLGRSYPGHSALRHYYMFRNAVELMKRSYVPWSWKSTEFVKLPIRLIVYGCFMPSGMEHVRLSILGVRHGLSGRLGPFRR